jgi:hypothetical protein
MFSPDGSRLATVSGGNTVIWDVRLQAMSAQGLVAEACARLVGGIRKLTRDEMRLAGYPDSMREIDSNERIFRAARWILPRHRQFLQKSLNRFGAISVYRTVC